MIDFLNSAFIEIHVQKFQKGYLTFQNLHFQSRLFESWIVLRYPVDEY